MFRRLLLDLASEGRIVDIRRASIDPHDLRGRPVRVSEELVLVELIGDEGGWSGFCALHMEDVTLVRYGNRQLCTWERTLQKTTPQPFEHLSLASWDALLRSATRQGEIATLYCEGVDTMGLYSGRNFSLRGEVIVGDLVSPDGEADGRFAVHMSTITRVTIGGAYERGLQRLAHFLNIEQKN
jgi:hypothetical protein